MAFNHENLNVYHRILPFNVKVAIWIDAWDSKHAICDQLSRAAGSMLENVAMASAAYSSMKHRALVEYSTPGEGIDKARDKARDKENFSLKPGSVPRYCLRSLLTGRLQ